MTIEIILAIVGIVGVTGVGVYVTRPQIYTKTRVITGENFAKLIYTDEKGGKLLVANEYGLQGKPDYIFQKWFTKKLIPFEIKSGGCKEALPHEGDLMQLAAYFLIIEEVYGTKPPYGRLVYNNKTFTIRNTRTLRKSVVHTLNKMHRMLERDGRCERDAEPSYIKCKNCVCQKTVCEWYDKKQNLQ